MKYREHLSDKKERESRQREEELNREMAADKVSPENLIAGLVHRKHDVF